MTAIPVTDADREAAAKAVEMGEAWLPLLFAKTRSEGAASERELCAEAVEAVASRFRAAHDPVSENAADECYMAIRARGEGGAK